MPLLLTPRQLGQRSDLYHQLAQLESAGLGLVRTLEQLQRHPPARAFRQPLRRLLDNIAQGHTFSESAERAGPWLPPFDLALLHAGEQSGRLDACFRLLSDYYTDRARVARQLIADLLYPAFLFHFAIFIFPFPDLFLTGRIGAYLVKTFGVLLPLYAGVFALIFAVQSSHGERWRALVEHVLRLVPILGTARHYLALSRLAAALEALLSAGVTMIESWQLAATASGSPSLRRTVAGWRPALAAGQTPAELVISSAQFPQIFANQYASGELAGKLDDVLHRLRNYYQEEGTHKLHAVAQWTPRLIYLVVVFMIAYYIIQWWTGYFKQIGAAGGF